MANRYTRFRVLKSVASGILAVQLVTSLVSFSEAQDRKKKEIGPTLVRTRQVELRPRATRQNFVGTLEPVRRSVIGSAVEERVEEVFVKEGDYVTANASNPAAVLVRLRRNTIDIELESAKIELTLRQKALEELSTTIPIQIDSARAEVGRVNAELEYARQVNDRMRGLAADGSMSQKEMEEAVSRFDSAQQALNVANAELQRLESTRDIRLAIANQNVARQQSELQRMQDLQSKYTVTAPFDGFVTRKLVEQGNWVTRGTPLVELVQLDPIELRIQVPQEYARRLQYSFDAASESAPLAAEIFIDSMDESVQGNVVRIIPDADPRTRSLPVIIQIDNPHSGADGSGGHLLKPGLLAQAVLNIGQGLPVLVVPKDALVLNQGETTIYLVDRTGDTPVVRQEMVATGNSNGNWIEVTGQVREGDEVVVQGNERLRNGETVRVLTNRQVP